MEQRPLKTLAPTNISIPSSSKSSQDKSSLQLKRKATFEKRHVPMRKRTKYLEWDYKVFNDSDGSVIMISDDEDDEGNNNSNGETFLEGQRQMNSLSERLAVAPSEKLTTEPKAENIRKSKIPSCLPLQDITPRDDYNREKREESKGKRRLKLNECLQERLRSPDNSEMCFMAGMYQYYTGYIFEYLLKVERKPLAVPALTQIKRACAINWLIKVNASSGNSAIIQTACWFLDSVVGTSHVPLNKLQLISAACYLIAQKMHGPSNLNVLTWLLNCASKKLSQKGLLAAEKEVLRTLRFPTQPVISSDYIPYLAWMCDSAPEDIENAATFICMAGLMVEKTLCEEYPSAIACAAVTTAVLLLKNRTMPIHMKSSPMYNAVKKKTSISRLSKICDTLRRAVRIIAEPNYKYKILLDYYGGSPRYIAERVIMHLAIAE